MPSAIYGVVIADVSGNPPVPFTPPIPGSIGLASRTNRASSGIVLFAKGVYAVQAVSTGDPSVDQEQPTTDLAFAEYALLP